MQQGGKNVIILRAGAKTPLRKNLALEKDLDARGLGAESLRAWPKGKLTPGPPVPQDNAGRVLRSRGGLENINQRGTHRGFECPLFGGSRGQLTSPGTLRDNVSPCTLTDISVTCMLQVFYNNSHCF